MTPRLFDERVGYFRRAPTTTVAARSKSPQRTFITRYRLEKKDPTAEISEPVKPIVYYVDPATPKAWVPREEGNRGLAAGVLGFCGKRSVTLNVTRVYAREPPVTQRQSAQGLQKGLRGKVEGGRRRANALLVPRPQRSNTYRMIRLIGIDVDGTLLDRQGRLPPTNRERQRACRGADHVALVTGRSYPMRGPSPTRFPRRFRSSSAAPWNRRWTARPWPAACSTVTWPERSSRRPEARWNTAALIFDRDTQGQVVFETMDWNHPGRKACWRRNRSLILQAVPAGGGAHRGPVKVMFNGHVAPMRVLAEALRDAATDYAVSLTEYPDRDFSLIDITATAATKGRAPRLARRPSSA